MTEAVLHFVRPHEVAAYERLGWTVVPDRRHSAYSVLMQWMGQGEPVKPFRVDPAPRETHVDDEIIVLRRAVASLEGNQLQPGSGS